MAIMVTDWMVAEHTETLSDYRYIHITLQTNRKHGILRCPEHSLSPVPDEKSKQNTVARWETRKRDNNLLFAATSPKVGRPLSWSNGVHYWGSSVVPQHSITSAMPQFKPSYRTVSSTYLWSEEIETTMTACVKTWRQFQSSWRENHRDLIHEGTL